MHTIVMDTNVLIAGLRSKHGFSNKLLQRIGNPDFAVAISAALILEYESVLKRRGIVPYTSIEIDEILDYICQAGQKHSIYFRWRPWLKDSSDDMILELAVSSRANYIVTFNTDDFDDIETFGIELITPKKFINILSGKK